MLDKDQTLHLILNYGSKETGFKSGIETNI